MYEAEINFSKTGDAAASAAANDKKLVEFGLEHIPVLDENN
jgi:hypothetical protein